jgi:hypothetical protein
MTMRVEGIGTRGKGGAALITAIVFVFFLTLFGLAFYQLGETDIDLFGHEEHLSQAFYASEAGIEKVRWMLKESHLISQANPFTNPFSSTYVEANALSIANPTSGDFFFPEADKPYFKVTEIKAEPLSTGQPGSRVKVQVFGSVDINADGEAGLIPLGGGKFDPDPEDVTRRFEAYIGLPGTLGEKIGEKGISAVADAFYAGGIEVSLSPESRVFITPDGDRIKDRNENDGFLYFPFPKGTYGGIWDQWGFIFSDPAPTVSSGQIDKVELPAGIFDDTTGEYVDEDTDTIPDYFQHLSLRTYAGDQTFTSSVDPTAGAAGRDVIYVNGNITIDGVDFGYLNDQGTEVKFCDWEKRDLAFIANGDITVTRVDCGNVGRLVLVAKNIILEGDYNTKVNGIAVAFNDITLDGKPVSGSGCDYKILTHPDTTRSVKYTAYFLGSMVAGNHIELLRDGWTVIYDENVINGLMYSTTLSKPTLTYERAEAEDFNTTNNWVLWGDELKYTQEDYIQEDIDNAKADYTDGGIDGTPELMKMYLQPIWHSADDDHDFPISDGVACDFTNAGNVFDDSDISIGSQDWDNYTTIHFYVALDNWEKRFLTKTTRRQSYFEVDLWDSGDNWLSFNLSGWGTPIYSNNDWLTQLGKVRWMLVRLNPHVIDPYTNFDMSSVNGIEFYYNDIRVSWYINDVDREWIGYDKTDTSGYGNDGYYYYMKFNGTDHDKYPVQFEKIGDRYHLYYEDPPGTKNYIQWNWDPSTPLLTADMYFKDTLNPDRSALDSVLKVDRIELPGKPASNGYLEYGLPHCLRLEVTNWQEL